MISFEKAKELIIENIKTLDHCEISFKEVNKRVLAEDIYSPRDVPPNRNSAMDGYAFKFKIVDIISSAVEMILAEALYVC